MASHTVQKDTFMPKTSGMAARQYTEESCSSAAAADTTGAHNPFSDGDKLTSSFESGLSGLHGGVAHVEALPCAPHLSMQAVAYKPISATGVQKTQRPYLMHTYISPKLLGTGSGFLCSCMPVLVLAAVNGTT